MFIIQIKLPYITLKAINVDLYQKMMDTLDEELEDLDDTNTLYIKNPTRTDIMNEVSLDEAAKVSRDIIKKFIVEIKRLCNLNVLGDRPMNVLNNLWKKYKPNIIADPYESISYIKLKIV